MRKPKIQWRHVAPAVLSIAAIVISAAGLYIQSLYGSSSLSMEITGFSLQEHDKSEVCSVDVALFNSGNRDTALLRAGLTQGKAADARNGTTYTEYLADSDNPGQVNAVVKGGDIRLLTFVFSGCQVTPIKSWLTKSGLNRFALVTDAVNYDGRRSNVSTSFATASVAADGDLAFALHLDGQFNLLKDGASYAGQSKYQSQTMSIDKDGRTHIDTTSNTSN